MMSRETEKTQTTVTHTNMSTEAIFVSAFNKKYGQYKNTKNIIVGTMRKSYERRV